AGGVLNVGSLNMTGGTLTAATAASQVNLGGNVTATSTGAGSARITGAGKLFLGGTTRTFTVNDGPQGTDLKIDAIIQASASEGITKAGLGRLELDAINAYFATRINAGDVEVDGSIADAILAGGTLSGIGTVGQITGTPAPTAAAVGTVSPGDNGAVVTTGIL